jgi:hypothetical protein
MIANKSKEDAVTTLLIVLKSQALTTWGGMTTDQAFDVTEFDFDSAVLDTACGKMLVFLKLNYWIGQQRTKKGHRTLVVASKWEEIHLCMMKMISDRLPE